MRGIGSFIPRRRARLLAVSFIVAAVSAMVAFWLVDSTRIGREVELRSIDMRFEARGPIPVDDDIVILAIDNNTDGKLNARFPYPRSWHGDVIRSLTAAGAKAIVFDVQFLQQTDPAQDAALVKAIADAGGRVVLATAPEGSTRVGERGAQRAVSKTPLPLRSVEVEGQDALQLSGAVVGNAEQLGSSDDVRRWTNPLREFALEDGTRRTIPSLSLAALAVSEGRSVFEYDALPDELEVNFTGPSSTYAGVDGFRYRNYNELCATPERAARPCGFDAERAERDYAWARGSIVLVGATSAVLQDLHPTPFQGRGTDTAHLSREMPGVEIHANAIQTLRDRSWITHQTPRAAALTAAGLVLAIWLFLAFTPMLFAIAAAAASLFGYALLAQRAFERSNEAWLATPTLFAGFAAFFCTFMLLGIQAFRERRRVTGLFARYVSPDVVRELVDISEELVVGGQRREISILFSDIRGFTTMSEQVDPAEMVGQLNEYFEQMIDAVEAQRGTFDKFIGDGLMAIFGAPLDMPDHADRACSVAVDMVRRLDELNANRARRGLEPLRIGIGIHSGDAIVGNIGSPTRRVDFTAIGDNVNLASRLESSTKDVGAQILVSKETAAAASTHRFESRGAIVVKGRSQSTEVFELLPDEVGQHEHRADADQGEGGVATPPAQAA